MTVENQFDAGNREDEEAKKNKEIAKMEKKLAKKEKKKAKKEMNGVKSDRDLEKFRIYLERLQLNWIKWNITCMALGFTVYKFYYARVQEDRKPLGYVITGRDIGIFLISLGIMSLLLATLQHKKNVTKLRLQYETMFYSLSLRLAYVILFFSIIILLIVLVRL